VRASKSFGLSWGISALQGGEDVNTISVPCGCILWCIKGTLIRQVIGLSVEGSSIKSMFLWVLERDEKITNRLLYQLSYLGFV
jgi:hypothetical protein